MRRKSLPVKVILTAAPEKLLDLIDL